MDNCPVCNWYYQAKAGNIFTQLCEICTDVFTWISQQADLRNHQEVDPEVSVGLETDFKLIQGGKGVPKKAEKQLR